MFSDVTFHIETFSTNMTFITFSIRIFTWKRHLRQCNVKSVENILKKEMIITEHINKKHQIFLVPVWRYQYFIHLLQNPNLKLMASFLNNHYWSYTFLNPWALKKIFIFRIPVRRKMVNVSPATNILLIQPWGKTYKWFGLDYWLGESPPRTCMMEGPFNQRPMTKALVLPAIT